MVADVFFVSFNAARLLGRPAAPLAELQPLDGEEGVSTYTRCRLPLGNASGERRRLPPLTMPFEARRWGPDTTKEKSLPTTHSVQALSPSSSFFDFYLSFFSVRVCYIYLEGFIFIYAYPSALSVHVQKFLKVFI